MKNTNHTVIYGHYGSGKTNFAISLSLSLAKQKKSVAIVDLDIVNPYFRTCDYKQLLSDAGVHLIASPLSGTTLDIPAITAEVYSSFSGLYDEVVFDVGGDDAGAYAMGRFSPYIRENPNYRALYIINMYRPLIAKPLDALQILREIEAASHLEATALVNNSHLCTLTTAETILESLPYAHSVSELTKLPLYATLVPEALISDTMHKYNSEKIAYTAGAEGFMPVQLSVKLPF